jgi:hypothetical protein
MPFIPQILKYKSLSIVGLEKNTGKTECLNYILHRFKQQGVKPAITSVGVDGEKADIVYKTSKPEIDLWEGVLFASSEKHYRTRRIGSSIIDLSTEHTALGRLVTARAETHGNLILSGPSTTSWLKNWITKSLDFGAEIVIIDGALSRLSPASPTVTEAMILNTGANVSADMKTLIKATKHVVRLINTEIFNSPATNDLQEIQSGVWIIDDAGNIQNTGIPSVLLLEKHKDKLLKSGKNIFAAGVITDKLLDFLRIQNEAKDITLICADFTKIFVSQQSYNAYIKSGAKLRVLNKTNLISICVNPVSVSGFKYDSNELCSAMNNAIGVPVYDIKNPDIRNLT